MHRQTPEVSDSNAANAVNEAPSRPASHERVPKATHWVWAYWIWFGVTVCLAAGSVQSVGTFEGVFASFGNDLPALTVWMLRHRTVVLLLPVLVLVPAIVFSIGSTIEAGHQRRFVAAFFVLVAVVLAGIAVVVTAMYLPILQLGAVV